MKHTPIYILFSAQLLMNTELLQSTEEGIRFPKTRYGIYSEVKYLVNFSEYLVNSKYSEVKYIVK